MMSLLVTLADGQRLQGFEDRSPLTAHSVATHPPGGSPNLRAVHKWLNIPFATAQRWSRPVPYVPTAETMNRDCFEYGATPMQGPGAVEPLWVVKPGWLNRDWVPSSEDCLNLNVYAPSEETRKRGNLPVMVWIFGGACNTGHAAAIRHDATELVRISEESGNPVIVVTGNYRLNIFGYISHPDLAEADPEGLTGNYGFYDQLAMLSWVQSHIHHFGGSPSNVTAFGESAGAYSISILATRRLATKDAPSLFQKAILQSGSPSTMAFRAPGYKNWDKLVAHFKLDDPKLSAKERVEGLRKISSEELLDFSVKNSVMGGWGGTIQKGGLWEDEPEQLFIRGDWDRGITEWVLGTCLDEGSLFCKAIPGKVETPEGFAALASRFPSPTIIQALYPDTTPGGPLENTPGSRLLADQVFLAPLRSLAISLSESSNPPTIRLYDFRQPLPQMSGSYGLGVHHGIEIPFIFGTRTFWKAGSDEDKTSDECMKRWSSFATDGAGKGTGPEWKLWSVNDPQRLIIGPRGGQTRVEAFVPSEVEKNGLAFWVARIRDPNVSTGLGA